MGGNLAEGQLLTDVLPKGCRHCLNADGLEEPGEAEVSRKSLLRMQEIIFQHSSGCACPAQPSPL